MHSLPKITSSRWHLLQKGCNQIPRKIWSEIKVTVVNEQSFRFFFLKKSFGSFQILKDNSSSLELKKTILKDNENFLLAVVLLSKRRKEAYVPEVYQGDYQVTVNLKKRFSEPYHFTLGYTVYGAIFFWAVLSSFPSRKPAWYQVSFLPFCVKRCCYA